MMKHSKIRDRSRLAVFSLSFFLLLCCFNMADQKPEIVDKPAAPAAAPAAAAAAAAPAQAPSAGTAVTTAAPAPAPAPASPATSNGALDAAAAAAARKVSHFYFDTLSFLLID